MFAAWLKSSRRYSRNNIAFLSIRSVAFFTLLFSTFPTAFAREDVEFYKPPSLCLTGSSCHNCVDTLQFRNHSVCCYQCRLDNIVMDQQNCHCMDIRSRDSKTDLVGNCSSGHLCDNCGVKISSDISQDHAETSRSDSFCCQDCGIVLPFYSRDNEICHCFGDLQGRHHMTIPRDDSLFSHFEREATNGGIIATRLTTSACYFHTSLFILYFCF